MDWNGEAYASPVANSFISKSIIRGGSRIPQAESANPPGGGRQHTNFSKNCMKIRKYLCGGEGVGSVPLDPPLILCNSNWAIAAGVLEAFKHCAPLLICACVVYFLIFSNKSNTINSQIDLIVHLPKNSKISDLSIGIGRSEMIIGIIMWPNFGSSDSLIG